MGGYLLNQHQPSSTLPIRRFPSPAARSRRQAEPAHGSPELVVGPESASPLTTQPLHLP